MTIKNLGMTETLLIVINKTALRHALYVLLSRLKFLVHSGMAWRFLKIADSKSQLKVPNLRVKSTRQIKDSTHRGSLKNQFKETIRNKHTNQRVDST